MDCAIRRHALIVRPSRSSLYIAGRRRPVISGRRDRPHALVPRPWRAATTPPCRRDWRPPARALPPPTILRCGGNAVRNDHWLRAARLLDRPRHSARCCCTPAGDRRFHGAYAPPRCPPPSRRAARRFPLLASPPPVRDFPNRNRPAPRGAAILPRGTGPARRG